MNNQESANKAMKYLSVMAFFLISMFLSLSTSYADMTGPQGIIPGTSPEGSRGILMIVGTVVGVVALISWLVIGGIRRKHNVVSK